MQENWLRGEKWWSTRRGQVVSASSQNLGFSFSPGSLFLTLSKGTSVSVVFNELYLTKSLSPDEGCSEANPSKGIFGQERGKAHSARFGDSVFWRPQFVLDCSVL